MVSPQRHQHNRTVTRKHQIKVLYCNRDAPKYTSIPNITFTIINTIIGLPGKQPSKHTVEEQITDCNGLDGSEGTLKKKPHFTFEVPRTAIIISEREYTFTFATCN